MPVRRRCRYCLSMYAAGTTCPCRGSAVRNPTPQKAARKQALALYGSRCAYVDADGVRCTVTDPAALDACHVVPLARGGSYDLSNIVLLCNERGRSHHALFDRGAR